MSEQVERIRFVRGVIFRGEGVAPGHEADVSPQEAFRLVEGYGDAVRVDGTGRRAVSSTVNLTDGLEVTNGDPVAEHRDPEIKPAGRGWRR